MAEWFRPDGKEYPSVCELYFSINAAVSLKRCTLFLLLPSLTASFDAPAVFMSSKSYTFKKVFGQKRFNDCFIPVIDQKHMGSSNGAFSLI